MNRDLFRPSLEPSQIIKSIQLELRTTLEPSKTLLVYDEVQEAPEALTALKYFCETTPEYQVSPAANFTISNAS